MLISEQPNPDVPCILVTAVESCVYHSPATDHAILNVSTRAPPTGRGRVLGRVALPPTAFLMTNFIRWPADPATDPVAERHLWVQLFAFTQGQYLFANSSDYTGKRPLRTERPRLCAWWGRVIGQVGGDVFEATSDATSF
jgi:regulator of Ty1 transposition protein 109